MKLESLNESSRVLEIRTLIQSKKALHHFYSLSYEKYRQCLKEKFEKKFSLLRRVSYSPHTPLLYWVSGGLKKWSMAPKILIPFWQFIDRLFLKISRDFGSFTDIEIYKRLEA